jgi:hypothetical protein
MNLKKEKMTKILVFQPILYCFTILESLEKFQKHTKYEYFWNQRAICHQKKYHVAF